MSKLTLHIWESVPQAYGQQLQLEESQLSFIPNLFIVNAESPATHKLHQVLTTLFDITACFVNKRQARGEYHEI